MYRNKSNRKKADTDLLFVAKMQLEHPEIDISTDILYRKYAAFKNGDIEGLIDKRGGWNKGHTDIPKHILDAFMYFFLDERRLPVSRCYQLMIEWVTEFYPQDLDKIPSERSFRRQAEKLPQAVIALMRYGEKAYRISNDCMMICRHMMYGSPITTPLTSSHTAKITHRRHIVCILQRFLMQSQAYLSVGI